MNIKKALSYVAFGFLITLVNFNFTLDTFKINILPDFIGWILLLMAINLLEDYVNDKSYLKILVGIMIIASAIVYVMEIVNPALSITGILSGILGIIEAIAFYNILDVMEDIAFDYQSRHVSSINMVKTYGFIISIILAIIEIAGSLKNTFGFLESFVLITSAVGFVIAASIVGLVIAIITAVLLFKLRKEISNQL